MSLDPTEAEVIRDAIAAKLADLFTSSVARVVKYDDKTQTADVQPVMSHPFNSLGDTDFDLLPVIPNVMVRQPRANGFFLHMPVTAGDHVLLVFTHDDISNWRETGSDSTPSDLRRHSLGSCVAFVGCVDSKSPLSPLPLDLGLRVAGMVLGKDGTPAQVSWDGDTIVVGRPDPLTKRVSFAALADRTDARLQALEAQLVSVSAALIALTATVAASASAAASSASAYASHTHSVPAPVGAPTGPPTGAMSAGGPPGAPPAAFVPQPLTTAADVLKGTGPLV